MSRPELCYLLFEYNRIEQNNTELRQIKHSLCIKLLYPLKIIQVWLDFPFQIWYIQYITINVYIPGWIAFIVIGIEIVLLTAYLGFCFGYTVKKGLSIFPSIAGMSLTKLSLAGNHTPINRLNNCLCQFGEFP